MFSELLKDKEKILKAAREKLHRQGCGGAFWVDGKSRGKAPGITGSSEGWSVAGSGVTAKINNHTGGLACLWGAP